MHRPPCPASARPDPRLRRPAAADGLLPAREAPGPGGARAPPPPAPPPPSCGSATSRTSPTPRRSSAWRTAVPAGAGQHQAHHPDLQRRRREAVERAARRFAGRRLHRLRPGDQRLRQVQRRGRPADRRGDLRRRPARGQAGDHHPRAAQGQDVATPQKGNTQDIALKKWLKAEQPDERHGPGRRHRSRTSTTRARSTVQARAGRRRLAARAVELAAGADAGAQGAGGREAPVAGRQVPDHRADRPHGVPAGAPETVEALLRAQQKAIDFAATDPAQAKTVTNEAVRAHRTRSLAPAVLDRAFTKLSLSPTRSPRPSRSSPRTASRPGITEKETDLAGFVDVTR